MSRSFSIVACVLALLVSCARPRPAPPPATATLPTKPPEIRAVWVSDTPKLNWDTATADLQRAGFNTMYVNFASAGAAFYPRSYVLPDASAGNDIARGIGLAHQRGLEVHAKLITFFMFKATPEFQSKLIKAGRVMRTPDGKAALQTGNAWLCPTQPINRAQIESVITEMLSRYRVDGLQFDYIRFFEEPTCFCAHCRQSFELATDQRVRRWPADVQGGPATEQFFAWRRKVINDCIRQFSDAARRARPGIKLSASVFMDLDRARQERAQDWRLWLDRGWIDYVATMTYRPDPREFEAYLRKQGSWAGARNRVVAGIGSWKLERMPELQAQIDITRRLGAPGFALFSYDDAAARGFLPNLQ
jgi:uncharacterized lipoprotein YddW (UPF0748 family)